MVRRWLEGWSIDGGVEMSFGIGAVRQDSSIETRHDAQQRQDRGGRDRTEQEKKNRTEWQWRWRWNGTECSLL